MFNICAASKCTSGYASDEKKQIAKFYFPQKNADLKKQCIRFVNRRDWIATKQLVLCELHFEEKYLGEAKNVTTLLDKSCTHCLSPKSI